MNRDRAALEVRIENRWLNMAVQVRHLDGRESPGHCRIYKSESNQNKKIRRRKDVRSSARKENFWQKFPEGVRNN
jgi:hypothetical protein